MLALLTLPVAALVLGASPADIEAGLEHPLFFPALWLTAQTSIISLALVVLFGTPLAWWLAVTDGRGRRFVELLVDLPIVLPPAVVGIALLQAFGRQGLLGSTLDALGLQISFSTAAVVLAQVLVSAPFYIQSAASAFRRVEGDLLLVARTLGQSRIGSILRVGLPLALPGLMAGAALAWARALGEFGATLLFAGNLPGTTQTLPLAIYTALESDVRAALAIALVLAGVSVCLLFGLRILPQLWGPQGGRHNRPADGGSP